MELRVYNSELNLVGITENQRSIIWTRKYGFVGEFSILVPITEQNVRLFRLGNIVWMRGAKEAGVIEDVVLRQTEDSSNIEVSGRFLESYMDRRLIRPTTNFSGTVENAMRAILENAEPIPRVVLEDEQGLTEDVSFQATYKNLLAYMEKLARSANYGFRFRPDFSKKTITFEIFRGLDRTLNQSDRARVVFSEAYNNLSGIAMTNCDQLYKNIAYIGGEGEGDQRVFAVAGDDSISGLERREVFVDARNIRSDGLTQEQYVQKLQQSGYDNLNESVISRAIEFTTNVTGNFEYKKHYDLGDIVTVQKEAWGVHENMRISEVMEVYEHSVVQATLTLGTPLPDKIDWEEN